MTVNRVESSHLWLADPLLVRAYFTAPCPGLFHSCVPTQTCLVWKALHMHTRKRTQTRVHARVHDAHVIAPRSVHTLKLARFHPRQTIVPNDAEVVTHDFENFKSAFER